ncbi:MAG: hypothetical protein LBD96_03000 [Treponema sp.]|nr:hypothetical protein [Treponema sp.]
MKKRFRVLPPWGFFVSLILIAALCASCAPPVSDDIVNPKGAENADGTEEGEEQPQTPEITGHPQGGYTAALNSAGLSLTVTVKAPSGGGALSYQWYRAESATAEGTTVDGAVARSYAPPFDAEGTFYYYAAVTNTLGGKTATVASARAEIRVDASLAAYTLDQFGGKENEADTQSITFAFSKAIDTLELDDITVTDGSGSVARGTATMGSPNSANWVLPVTVTGAGTVRVSIAKDGVESLPKELTVFKSGQATHPAAPPDEEEPEGPPGLAGTAWAWSGVKLTFKETTVTMTGVAKPYPYTFDGTERTGSIDTLGDFTIDQDFLRLTFENFNNLDGGPKVFENLGAALTGSKWAWGQTFVTFESSRAVINGVRYPYTFNSAAGTGSIDKIGAFTLNEGGTLSIPVWRKSSYGVTLVKTEAPPAWNGSPVGTSWGWQNAFNGWMVIEFMTERDCILTHTESTYHDDIPWEFVYTWNSASQSGDIPEGVGTSEGFPGLGSFTINGDRSFMNFAAWRTYPHGALFSRIQAQ